MDPLRQSSRGGDREFEDSPRAERPGRSKESAIAADTQAFDPAVAELLHELNNVLVSMLLSAQVMEWKLPSYSRLKRNLHEMERNAQRGGELVKRLLQRMSAGSRGNYDVSDAEAGDLAAMDCAAAYEAQEVVIEAARRTATALPAASKKVPHTPV